MDAEEVLAILKKYVDDNRLAGTEITSIEVIPEISVDNWEQEGDVYLITGVDADMANMLASATHLTIKFDGVEYTCYALVEGSAVAFGNLSILDSSFEGTGEPFLLVASSEFTTFIVRSNESHSISVIAHIEKVEQIEERFIPNSIPLIELPIVITVNNYNNNLSCDEARPILKAASSGKPIVLEMNYNGNTVVCLCTPTVRDDNAGGFVEYHGLLQCDVAKDNNRTGASYGYVRCNDVYLSGFINDENSWVVRVNDLNLTFDDLLKAWSLETVYPTDGTTIRMKSCDFYNLDSIMADKIHPRLTFNTANGDSVYAIGSIIENSAASFIVANGPGVQYIFTKNKADNTWSCGSAASSINATLTDGTLHIK